MYLDSRLSKVIVKKLKKEKSVHDLFKKVKTK